ncbi:hypothetical protein M3Y97_00490000 [Aphelenchoides bicaudatus]|nr:hypothetical protein M3Y97_00490000 [Aphelenchoides bicaudatus]
MDGSSASRFIDFGWLRRIWTALIYLFCLIDVNASKSYTGNRLNPMYVLLIVLAICLEAFLIWSVLRLVGLGQKDDNKITYPSHLRLNRCYSCMSPMYKELFQGGELSQFFFEPKNFTSQCESPMDVSGVGLVPCRAICLTLTQEFTVMGRKTGRKLTMRGCATSLTKTGFHNQTIAIFDQYDLCRDVRASDLFRYGTDTQPITVCSCLGDKCNGAAFGASFRPVATLFWTLLLFAANFLFTGQRFL